MRGKLRAGNRIKTAAAILTSVLMIIGTAAVFLGMEPYVPERPDDAAIERVYPGGSGYTLNAVYADESTDAQEQSEEQLAEETKPVTAQKTEPEEKTEVSSENKAAESKTSADNKTSGKTGKKASKAKSGTKNKTKKSEKKEKKAEKELTLKTDIDDGETVKGTVRSFFVEAKDTSGNELTAFDVTVTVNGSVITSTGFNGGRITYKANLEKGSNTIVITVRDENGMEKTIRREIVSTGGEPEKLGTVTISARADTLSLGTVIPAAKVDIYEGEQLSHAVDRYLGQAGVGYTSKGSLDSGFYLSGISKSGIASGAEVPEKLAAALEEYSVTIGSGDKNSLKQKDYTTYSGWVVCVDGKFITSGMSGINVKPGSKIELLYTLYNGSDVDGSIDW